jgi:hypothetical protein
MRYNVTNVFFKRIKLIYRYLASKNMLHGLSKSRYICNKCYIKNAENWRGFVDGCNICNI